jgi:predicted short-subunit dehydrogenase-like oxidoreductase (DUF2520 family)
MMIRMKTLNVVGAGRVGQTLARLWAQSRFFTVSAVLDGSYSGAVEAVQFIGCGEPAQSVAAMSEADVWLIATPDRRIGSACAELGRTGRLRAGDVVFHSSGSLDSRELAAATALHAHVASVHPLKSFADPHEAVSSFAGTWCAAEGERPALDVLVPAYEAIGGRVFEIEASAKTLYHAASVIVCNDLTALIEAGLDCYARAGVGRTTAMAMIEPLVKETVQNVFRLGTARALTGPVARGDAPVVERHLEALRALRGDTLEIYRTLGLVAVQLARQQGEVDGDALARLEALLSARG